MKSGKLFVFEGISGTGKETQARLLKEYYLRKNIHSAVVFHPSPEIKMILTQWRKERSLDWQGEVYLLVADRYSRVKQMITPLLEQGASVVCLRNFTSALVYQARDRSEETWIREQFLPFEPVPDHTFLFEMDPEAALERAQKRHEETGEPMGKFETLNLLKEKLLRYRDVYENIPHTVIDASRPIEDIHREILTQLGEMQ